MNILSFRTTEDHGLSVELLIDGQSLVELVDLGDTLIPYYYFEGNLPLGYWGADDPSIKVIGVCSCGEAGCGSAECRVVREGDTVAFRDFSGCVNPNVVQKKKEEKEFRVTPANYDSIIAEIIKQVADYQRRT
ncbi:MAG: hypothetical protein LC754_15735 [Acidobacteria bacterium]|nr:hypothetical protein [Acidobacteriota bacterium]